MNRLPGEGRTGRRRRCGQGTAAAGRGRRQCGACVAMHTRTLPPKTSVSRLCSCGRPCKLSLRAIPSAWSGSGRESGRVLGLGLRLLAMVRVGPPTLRGVVAGGRRGALTQVSRPGSAVGVAGRGCLGSGRRQGNAGGGEAAGLARDHGERSDQRAYGDVHQHLQAWAYNLES